MLEIISEAEREAIEKLKNGGVVAHATEAVFGLAASAYDRLACRKISMIKERSFSQPFLVMCSSLGQVTELVDIKVQFEQEIRRTWPGHVSWVLPSQNRAPWWLKNDRGKIALRVTNHAQCIKIINFVGPIITTSANKHGNSPIKKFSLLEEVFGVRGGEIDFYLDGELGNEKRPSRIRDGVSGFVLRP